MRILTLNAGLLQLRLFGLSVYCPAPWVAERAQALPSLLLRESADVVLLQEVFDRRHRASLRRVLSDAYPFIVDDERGGRPSLLGCGLLVFSRFPVRGADLREFSDAHRSERWIRPPAALIVEIESSLGEMTLANVHATSGGTSGPETPDVEDLRSNEFRELASWMSATTTPTKAIVGDLNAGPEASPRNYDEILREGFTDPVIEAYGSERAFVSWTPSNPLNSDGPHGSCPAQRVDHFLLHPASTVVTRTIGVALDDESVDVDRGEGVTVSDHYAVVVELRAR